MNTKFYRDHNQTVCLTKFAVGQLENKLLGCKCKKCKSKLCIETSYEGTNVLCEKQPYNHACGYRIDCGIFTDIPQIKKML